MEVFLSKLTQQAMNYAIRSGISITSGFAIHQCSRLLKTVGLQEHDELSTLQRKLDTKIRIIAPAIDMIELIAARGNTSLESAVSLTKSIRWDIQQLGARVAKAASAGESTAKQARPRSSEAAEAELRLIMKDIRLLLSRIEDAVPLINLAITTSGASLSTSLPVSVSPSRLLQASTFLSAGDAQYAMNPRPTQIGPRFTLSMYMLFQGHSNAHVVDEESFRKTIWTEAIHKMQTKLIRTPIKRLDKAPFTAKAEDDTLTQPSEQIPGDVPGQEFAYQLSFIEDLDDGRVHDDEGPEHIDDVESAGKRTFIPVHQISKIFYADTGKILNLSTDAEGNSPIILLKRDQNAKPPRRLMELEDLDEGTFVGSPAPQMKLNKDVAGISDEEGDCRGLPNYLDPEWIALEVYNDDVQASSDDETSESDGEGEARLSSSRPSSGSYAKSIDATFTTAMSRLSLGSSTPSTPVSERRKANTRNHGTHTFLRGLPTHQSVTSSLSLLEMMIRLTSLQQFQQASHLTISDELLNFFLEESSTTGAPHGDANARKRIRMEARRHVGFDPYDESPIKRRGEDYQRSTFKDVDTRPGSWEFGDSPNLQSSPLHGKSKHSSSRASSMPAANHSSTPPLPGQSGTQSTILSSAPATGVSRADFLRDERASTKLNTPSKSSPLARPSTLREPAEGT